VSGNSLEARNCKYKLLTECDADFHNELIAYLFFYVCEWNITYYIVVTNEFTNDKVGSDSCQRTRE
jgi:hypothetical protein